MRYDTARGGFSQSSQPPEFPWVFPLLRTGIYGTTLPCCWRRIRSSGNRTRVSPKTWVTTRWLPACAGGTRS